MKVCSSIFLFVCVLLISPQQAIGSSNNIDSLELMLKSVSDADNKFEILISLSDLLIDSNNLKSYGYTKDAVRLARELSNESMLAQALVKLAYINIKKYDLNSALQNSKESLELALQNNFTREECFSYLNLGLLSIEYGDISRGSEYLFMALKGAEENNFEDCQAKALNGIGTIYLRHGNQDKALEFYNKAFVIFERLEKKQSLPKIYLNMAATYGSQRDFDKAQDYCQKSLSLSQEINDIYTEGLCYLNFSLIYQQKKDTSLSLINLRKAVTIAEKIKHSVLKGNSLLRYSQIYFTDHNFESSINYGMKAYRLGKADTIPILVRSASRYLQLSYSALNKYDSAYKYQGIYNAYVDSFRNEKAVNQVILLDMKYKHDKELELKQYQVEIQDKKILLLQTTVFAIVMLVLVIFLIFLLVYRKKRNQVKQAELVKKNLEIDLEFRNKELVTNAMYLLKKNEFMQNIAEELKNSMQKFNKDNQKYLISIITEIYQNTSQDDWKEFETRFQKVYFDFNETLNRKFPSLTPNELKLCAFLKLNMTTKEIAAITYQSTNSIEVARYRLRKKLGLDKYDSLIEFLNHV